MNSNRLLSILMTFFMVIQAATAQSLLEKFNFQIVERTYNEGTRAYDYYALPINGTERKNNALNRLSILSENQYSYPDPESGCGPTAMLNILVWYEKYGLIQPTNRDADTERYKQLFFKEIDQRLNKKSGSNRADQEGTNNMDAAMVMDELVNERSNGRLRVHTDYMTAPLKLADFLEIMPNFRAGYLIVRPKEPETGELKGLHAVTVIRADRAGYITFGSWGEIYRGLLKKRDDAQWFIPQDSKQLEFKVVGLMRFIPFEPTVAAGR